MTLAHKVLSVLHLLAPPGHHVRRTPVVRRRQLPPVHADAVAVARVLEARVQPLPAEGAAEALGAVAAEAPGGQGADAAVVAGVHVAGRLEAVAA